MKTTGKDAVALRRQILFRRSEGRLSRDVLNLNERLVKHGTHSTLKSGIFKQLALLLGNDIQHHLLTALRNN